MRYLEEIPVMVSSSLREARVRLNELVRRALAGEDVVLMRGSKPVVALTPITSDDLELAPRVTDAQAARIHAMVERERKEGKLLTFASPAEAVATLSRSRGRGRS